MPVWRKAIPREIRQGWPTSERRTIVMLRGPGDLGGAFEVCYRCWTGPPDVFPLGPLTVRNPEQVIEYRAPGRLTFATLEEARECAKAWARRLPDFEREEFQVQMGVPPPICVKELAGPDPSLKAWIMQHHGGSMEVRCFHHEVVAETEDGSHVEWEWVRIRSEAAVFADDLQEAEAVAREELADEARSNGK